MEIGGKFGDFIKFRSQVERRNGLNPRAHCSSHTKKTCAEASGQVALLAPMLTLDRRVTVMETEAR